MDDVQNVLKSTCSRVVSQYSDHKQLCRKFIDITDAACIIAKDVHLYDFPGIKCNGFRYAIETTIRLMEYVIENTDNQPSKDLLQLVTLVHCSLQYFKKIHYETSKLPLNENGSRSLIYDDYQLVTEAFQCFLDSNAMDVLCCSMSGFHLPKPEGPLLRMAFYYFMPFAASPDAWTGLRTLFDFKLKRQVWRDAFRNLTLDYVKAIDIWANSYYIRKVVPLFQVSMFHPQICKDIHVPRQKQVRIECILKTDEQEVKLTRVQSTGETSRHVRCRLLMDNSNVLHGDSAKTYRPVVLHAHGGGFAIGSADNHEMYTRSWTNKLPSGTAFVSVDYSLAPEIIFPEQLQQLLDVFLWLSNGDSCKSYLGYIPNKIILVGDSSGGLNLCALLMVIKDVEEQFPDIPIIFPSGLIAIYPSFCVAPIACPSMLMSCLHPELSPPAFLTMISGYMPFSADEPKQRSNKETEITLKSILTWLVPQFIRPFFTGERTQSENNNNSRQNITWWNQSTQISLQRLQRWNLMKHPYASPLFCDDFSALARTELSLFVVDSDPILDHAIYLANKWQGKVSLYSIKDCIHAFLPMADAGCGSKYSVHRDKISQEINRLVGQCNPLHNN